MKAQLSFIGARTSVPRVDPNHACHQGPRNEHHQLSMALLPQSSLRIHQTNIPSVPPSLLTMHMHMTSSNSPFDSCCRTPLALPSSLAEIPWRRSRMAMTLDAINTALTSR